MEQVCKDVVVLCVVDFMEWYYMVGDMVIVVECSKFYVDVLVKEVLEIVCEVEVCCECEVVEKVVVERCQELLSVEVKLCVILIDVVVLVVVVVICMCEMVWVVEFLVSVLDIVIQQFCDVQQLLKVFLFDGCVIVLNDFDIVVQQVRVIKCFVVEDELSQVLLMCFIVFYEKCGLLDKVIIEFIF